MSKHIETDKVFTAFSDKTRIKVLEILKTGEKCAAMLLEQVSVGQSTLSHHMKILVESGIVSARKVNKWTYYSICESGKQYAVELLNKLTARTKTNVKEECEYAPVYHHHRYKLRPSPRIYQRT